MLDSYLLTTRRLLQNPAAGAELYDDASLKAYINTARKQLAGEAECIRIQGTIPTVGAQQAYDFADIDTGTPSVTGIDGVYNLRQVRVGLGDGSLVLTVRPYPWFESYYLNSVVPPTGPPTVWSQYSQGVTGSFYLWPIPDSVLILTADTVCKPVDLADNTTVEAIPYPWTDAVPYFAAYYAYLAAQRTDDADKMFAKYQEFQQRGRKISTPGVVPNAYPQSGEPARAAQLGLNGQGGQQ